MTDVQINSCRLCLKTITDKSFIIDNVTRDILDVLLLKLKFDDEGNEVICNACRRKLYAALEFKSSFVNIDNTIIPHVDSEKMLQLELREAYVKEKGSELLMGVFDSQKICRLCMQPVEREFRCIREEELEAIEKLAPEININISKDPVVCKPCSDSLCTHNSFLKDCLEVVETIRGTIGSSTIESQMDTSVSDLFARLKTELSDKEFDINEMEMSIKTESIDIKAEDEERNDTHSPDNESFAESDWKDGEEDGCKHENGSGNECNTTTKEKHKVLYKCDKCVYETGSKRLFMRHFAKHENYSEAYKSSKYETENKELFQRHLLRHKNPLGIRVHRCESCNYTTKRKSDLAKHQVKHKCLSEARLYKCHFRDFKTKWKASFNNHYLKHKDSNKCDECDYKIEYKGLPYEDASQLLLYKYNGSDCELKNKKLSTSHQLMHKYASQVKMYKCDECDYETKYKNSFKQHELKHKDPSQIQMYICNNCNYKSNYKNYIKEHQLKHKDLSQVQMYRCNDCNYETKYRSNIKQHLPKHKNPSQVKMYRCDNCDYKSIWKRDMKQHQLKHKQSS